MVVIPARYASVRFPGKPLAMLHGKPMIQHVYEQAARAAHVDEVVVATDDERIAAAVGRFGGKVAVTSPTARSGSERVAEVARSRHAEVIINVQGDEPLIQPEMVSQLADFLSRHQAVPMASLMTKLSRPEDVANPNIVKVVVDRDGYALYFSRSPIPFMKPETRDPRPETSRSPVSGLLSQVYYKHLGIYGYQRHFLLQFPHLEPTPLEQAEQLEQLRALEHGYRIKLLETMHDTIGVDTPEDLQRVEQLLARAAARA